MRVRGTSNNNNKSRPTTGTKGTVTNDVGGWGGGRRRRLNRGLTEQIPKVNGARNTVEMKHSSATCC